MPQLDGRAISEKIKLRAYNQAKIFEEKYGEKIKLAVLFVGDNPASQIYVRNKKQACIENGFLCECHFFKKNVTQEELELSIEKLNQDPRVHGILLQLPLPPHLNSEKLLSIIAPIKDVDGFHPLNVGKLSQGLLTFVPCTPKGIITLLDAYNLSLAGKQALILGRSNIVGKPLFQLFLKRDATVILAHSKSQNIDKLCKNADIVVAAIGVPNFVKKDWISKKAILIDVGINHIEKDDRCELVGDISEEAKAFAAYATPVPGGVGPMTIASLLENLIQAALIQKEGSY